MANNSVEGKILYMKNIKKKILKTKSYVDTFKKEEFKKRLKEAVETSEKNRKNTNRGISEFIYEVSSDLDEIEFRSLHQRAIDKNVYGFNLHQNAWFFKSAKDGEFNEYIVAVLPTQMDEKDNIMIDHLRNTEKTYYLVKSAVEGYNINGDTKYSSIKNFGKFKSYCAGRGIDTTKKTRLELEKELMDQDKSK